MMTASHYWTIGQSIILRFGGPVDRETVLKVAALGSAAWVSMPQLNGSAAWADQLIVDPWDGSEPRNWLIEELREIGVLPEQGDRQQARLLRSIGDGRIEEKVLP